MEVKSDLIPMEDKLIAYSQLSDNGCWEWQKSKDKDGYGQVTAIKPFKGTKAHRLAYEVFVGKIPEGLMVLHTCDNTCCINPLHLFVGTNIDNMQDKQTKGRCGSLYGEKHPKAKLTEKQVRDIKFSLTKPKILTEKYGVNHTVISAIRNGKVWKHIV